VDHHQTLSRVDNGPGFLNSVRNLELSPTNWVPKAFKVALLLRLP